MLTHSKRSDKKLLKEKKKFSFRNHGISVYHAVPAVIMAVTGVALSAVISDVPPSVNKVYASSVEANAAEIGNFTQMFSDTVAEMLTQPVVDDADTNEESKNKNNTLGFMDFVPTLKPEERQEEEESFDFSAYTTALTSEQISEKLDAIALAERQRELYEASGQVVASSNRNLYLDHYRYQRGPSNIPSTGAYTYCAPGQVISQMVPPSSLTFDENGVPENYLYYIDGKATAYYGGYMTATGSSVRPGVVAVDPREIPYGTEMWIVSSDGQFVYGFARAEDTGGFIYWPHGATVDLYMNSYADCCVWGWRGVRIYILPTSYK